MDSLVQKLVAVSNLIYERTQRHHAHWLMVEKGTPLWEAIVRGDLRELGIAPENGYEVEGGMIRFDKPAVSAVDLLASLVL